MKPNTTPDIGLEKILTQRQIQYDDLLQKYNTLNSPVSSVEVSYSLDLSYSEQIKYAKIGMFHYYTDLNNLSTMYKNNGVD